ncbi:hypothetical protein Ae406Ps2_1233 [Pseudonocardia sp. Ae406_Ps2]|nr:hypothetical protein Ae406Ps2_1233 [Pseudonocardia sp. Ae406_Ps2]OLM06970.1 hypothetical protein Ae331Ps2_4680c [Pseudonocardia sp. Ae331_Ps2]OLM14148.1 hypothetical protein Ae505Ps2_4278c [Pseudonocardia sp. Ae505_Ps2]OLM22806.1 hypothetical protein Ae706Ps2_1238 [Pseudonocardia sp. Ae706_Ps2]
MVDVTPTTAHAPTVPTHRPAHSRGASMIVLPVLTAVLGCGWGALSASARLAEFGSIVAVTDTWWSWAAVLGLSAMVSRRFSTNLMSVLACGIAAVSTYYLLKAHWMIGFSSRHRDFWQYLQTDSWERWTLLVLVFAVPAAVVGTAVGRLLRLP